MYSAWKTGTLRLYLRGMNDLEAKPIAGTEGGYQPFFSPDGEWVGFFHREGVPPMKLKKEGVAHRWTGGDPVRS